MDPNPQAETMASEAMIRTLHAQASALWPQESGLFQRYALPEGANILDVACGTGEISRRLAERYPEARVVGVDVHAPHLARARHEARRLSNVRFHEDDAFALSMSSASQDLTVCRSLVQSIPRPERVLAELFRVLKPGGHLHLLAEDYGMIHFSPTQLDTDDFWRRGPWTFGDAIHNDLRIGRKMHAVLRELGFEDVTVDYLTVDTIRVDRAHLIQIWEAWRDGYTETVAEHSPMSVAEIRAHWTDMLDCLRNPEGYALWHVPIWSAVKPER